MQAQTPTRKIQGYQVDAVEFATWAHCAFLFISINIYEYKYSSVCQICHLKDKKIEFPTPFKVLPSSSICFLKNNCSPWSKTRLNGALLALRTISQTSVNVLQPCAISAGGARWTIFHQYRATQYLPVFSRSFYASRSFLLASIAHGASQLSWLSVLS